MSGRRKPSKSSLRSLNKTSPELWDPRLPGAANPTCAPSLTVQNTPSVSLSSSPPWFSLSLPLSLSPQRLSLSLRFLLDYNKKTNAQRRRIPRQRNRGVILTTLHNVIVVSMCICHLLSSQTDTSADLKCFLARENAFLRVSSIRMNDVF